MLKSLFLKKKETEELLPPPPPFPSMELEEPKQEDISVYKFEELFNDAEKEVGLEEAAIKNTKVKLPKKLSKKDLKKLAKIKDKKTKLKTKGKIKSAKEEFYDLGRDFDFGQEPEFQDLEEFSIENLKSEEIKPKEIEKAEDEITNAIEGAKKQDKKSFFSGLFSKKNVHEQEAMMEIEAVDLDAIKKKINDARNALTNLDLETAKNCYIDILRLYNKLKPEEQAQVYHEVKDIYNERKNAEELKM